MNDSHSSGDEKAQAVLNKHKGRAKEIDRSATAGNDAQQGSTDASSNPYTAKR